MTKDEIRAMITDFEALLLGRTQPEPKKEPKPAPQKELESMNEKISPEVQFDHNPFYESNHVLLKDKPILSLIEAAEYTGIGRTKLCRISDDPDCDFVLWNGSKRMFKKDKLIAYLNKTYSI